MGGREELEEEAESWEVENSRERNQRGGSWEVRSQKWAVEKSHRKRRLVGDELA